MFRTALTNRRHFKGLTLTDTLALMIIGALTVAVLMPTLSAARSNAQGPPDASRMRSIHEAWMTYAAGNGGLHPTPGLINRQPVNGMQIPGVGEEDHLQNHTGNIHSACIMLGLYAPESCVGTTEPSSKVVVKGDYNFDLYDPGSDQYWDTTFLTDLSIQSNLSYASMPVAGERQITHWRDSGETNWTILGNRGVRNGFETTYYNDSITLQIHGSKKRWEGYTCFGDNHFERLKSFRPTGMEYELIDGVFVPDNIFRNEVYGMNSSHSTRGNDRWLVISRQFAGTANDATSMQNSWD